MRKRIETPIIPQIRSHSEAPRETFGFNSIIISETTANRMQWEDPIGKPLKVGDHVGTVIGVVKDFLFADIGFSVPPAVLFLEPDNLNLMLIKFSSADGFPALHQFIKEKWQGIMLDLPLNCKTLEDHFNQFFTLLDKFTGFLNIIGITAILFSCLGLLGLSSYLVERRTKEIGIRKKKYFIGDEVGETSIAFFNVDEIVFAHIYKLRPWVKSVLSIPVLISMIITIWIIFAHNAWIMILLFCIEIVIMIKIFSEKGRIATTSGSVTSFNMHFDDFDSLMKEIYQKKNNKDNINAAKIPHLLFTSYYILDNNKVAESTLETRQ